MIFCLALLALSNFQLKGIQLQNTPTVPVNIFSVAEILMFAIPAIGGIPTLIYQLAVNSLCDEILSSSSAHLSDSVPLLPSEHRRLGPASLSPTHSVTSHSLRKSLLPFFRRRPRIKPIQILSEEKQKPASFMLPCQPTVSKDRNE